MSMLVLLGAVMVVIFIASILSLAQTTPIVPVAVSGDADTGPETVSVVFQVWRTLTVRRPSLSAALLQNHCENREAQ
jgi:hypothetical protein